MHVPVTTTRALHPSPLFSYIRRHVFKKKMPLNKNIECSNLYEHNIPFGSERWIAQFVCCIDNYMYLRSSLLLLSVLPGESARIFCNIISGQKIDHRGPWEPLFITSHYTFTFLDNWMKNPSNLQVRQVKKNIVDQTQLVKLDFFLKQIYNLFES
jgi:hypothetical protein